MQSREAKELQKKIRTQFEASYTEKLKHLHSLFKNSLGTLESAIEKVFDRIKNDEILSTMLKDDTTSMHTNERIKQIFNESITQEVQYCFKTLNVQNANLKSAYDQLYSKYLKLKDSNDNLEKNCYTERITFEEDRNSVNRQLKRTKQQKQTIQGQQLRREKILQEFRTKIATLQEENKELRILLQSMKKNQNLLTKYEDDAMYYQEKYKRLQLQNDQLKQALKTQQQNFNRKYHNKKRQYKQKIQEYVAVINQMRNNQNGQTIKKNQEFNMHKNHQKTIANLIKQHQKKLADFKFQKQKEKNKMQKDHQYKIKEMTNYLQKLLQSKILQVQDNTGNYYQNMIQEWKQENLNMEKQISDYKINYVPLQQCQIQLNKRQELLQIMKQKLQKFQNTHSGMNINQKNIQKQLAQKQQLLNDNKKTIKQLQDANQQLKASVNSLQQINSMLKISETKSKSSFQSYETALRQHQQDYSNLQKNNHAIEQEKSKIQAQLRQKQWKFKKISEELDIATKKISQTLQNRDDLERNNKNLTTELNQTSKELSSLQFRYKDLEMKGSLVSQSLQNKINSMQQQIKEKANLLADIQQRYQQASKQFQDVKKNNYQLQTQLKKSQMQGNFYKQSSQMHKQEHKSALDQMKKIIKQKSQQIQVLNTQIDKKNNIIHSIEHSQTLQKESNFKQNKTLRYKIKKISQLVIVKLGVFRKDLNNIVDYVNSRLKIIGNEQSIFKSSLNKELIKMQFSAEQYRNQLIKKVREQIEEKFKIQSKAIKNDFEDKSKLLSQKEQHQKSLLRKEIKQKNEVNQQITRELKKIQIQLKRQKDEHKSLQYQLDESNNKLLRQKESYHYKIQEQIRQMTQDKDAIIKQYDIKRQQMQREIQRLINTIKKIKKETEQLQARHEQQKISINAQIRTIKQQQQTIQKIGQQKDLQIQKNQQDYQQLLQNNKYLQEQIRGMSQHINVKIHQLQELQIQKHQITAEYHLLKSKSDRIQEENSEAQRKIAQIREQLQETKQYKSKLESELKQIKSALGRSNKTQQLKTLNELSVQTLQLSQKVNQMRKMSVYLDGKTPLRS